MFYHRYLQAQRHLLILKNKFSLSLVGSLDCFVESLGKVSPEGIGEKEETRGY